MCKREKRLLLLMREYVLGGAETQFRYLIEYAEKQKWKLDVLIEHDLNRNDEKLKKCMERMRSVRFYELEGDRSSGELTLAVMFHILKVTMHTKYTACLIYYPPDLVFAPFMFAFGIRVVYSERVDAADIIDNTYYQKCLKFCNQILTNSKYAEEKLEKLTGRKVLLIRNGKKYISEFPLKRERKIRRILVPARIAPPKNQLLPLYFLKCCKDFDGKIIFAGLVEDRAYCSKLKQFVRKNELQDKVEFLGYVEEMSEEYRKADLILLPSYAEGTPNVVLEAYAYGRPVIVSDIEEEREIVPDYRLRFATKDPEGVGACIRYVQDMPNEAYSQLIKKNREIVLQNYSIKKMAESFYTVLSNR